MHWEVLVLRYKCRAESFPHLRKLAKLHLQPLAVPAPSALPPPQPSPQPTPPAVSPPSVDHPISPAHPIPQPRKEKPGLFVPSPVVVEDPHARGKVYHYTASHVLK